MSKIMRELYAEARHERDGADAPRERKRYSADQDDALGYLNYQMALLDHKVCKVFLDGNELKGVVTADELTGTVVVCVQPYVIENNELKLESLHGVVRVDLGENIDGCPGTVRDEGTDAERAVEAEHWRNIADQFKGR